MTDLQEEPRRHQTRDFVASTSTKGTEGKYYLVELRIFPETMRGLQCVELSVARIIVLSAFSMSRKVTVGFTAVKAYS